MMPLNVSTAHEAQNQVLMLNSIVNIILYVFFLLVHDAFLYPLLFVCLFSGNKYILLGQILLLLQGGLNLLERATVCRE